VSRASWRGRARRCPGPTPSPGRWRWPLAALLALSLARPAGAAPPAAAAAETAAAGQLRRCDDLAARRQIAAARVCYQELRQRHAGSNEAHDADRALRTLSVIAPELPREAGGTERRFFVLDPYSSRTGERLHITSWEKLDFTVTAYVYGLSIGASAGLAADATANTIFGLMVGGAVVYTGLALTYLGTPHVDRADLPLALAITSYVPLTTALVALSTDWTGPGASTAIVGTAIAALPIASLAVWGTDLDPGDTQLVREAGFWGMFLGVTLSLQTSSSTRVVGGVGLAGLYGGMGLGLIAAAYSEVSLERARVSTWGGYTGGVLGFLVAGAIPGLGRSTFSAIAGGSAAGLLLTFAATRGLDAAPPHALALGRQRLSLRCLEPTVLPLVSREGRLALHPALTVVQGRF
jgi:hypothetical protein